MKVRWELDTTNPGDLQVLAAMNKLIQFQAVSDTGTEEQPPTVEPEPTPPKAVEPAPEPALPKAVEPDQPDPPKPAPKSKKRQPKVKNQEQLDKLSLEEIVAYLKARKDHSMLDARFLAKHYNTKFNEFESLLTILHDLGASNFEDLKEPSHFIKNAIPMIEEKLADTADETKDIFGV